ncbi:hypothetical protein [Ornithinimicrobium cavernae]|uniref:hypothetical protein n=1 Tax=Ornithinimicrobium cavernae TaxID=2666047 RepID=UPI0012B170B2|nr:hypothetical protein [Ornithinimicrobium cavernae]
MHRLPRKWVAAAATVALVPAGLFATAAPASATVHEIVAQWCSGQDPLEPPGVSGGSNGDNFAKPLMASGFIGDPVPFRDGLLIPFDYGAPASKVMGTGIFVPIQTQPVTIYIELIQPDPTFPAFQHCPRLATG